MTLKEKEINEMENIINTNIIDNIDSNKNINDVINNTIIKNVNKLYANTSDDYKADNIDNNIDNNLDNDNIDNNINNNIDDNDNVDNIKNPIHDLDTLKSALKKFNDKPVKVTSLVLVGKSIDQVEREQKLVKRILNFLKNKILLCLYIILKWKICQIFNKLLKLDSRAFYLKGKVIHRFPKNQKLRIKKLIFWKTWYLLLMFFIGPSSITLMLYILYYYYESMYNIFELLVERFNTPRVPLESRIIQPVIREHVTPPPPTIFDLLFLGGVMVVTGLFFFGCYSLFMFVNNANID